MKMLRQATGDDIPRVSVIHQRENPQEDVPIKTRLPESEIHQYQIQQPQIPEQSSQFQHAAVQQRQQQYELIQQRKNINQQQEIKEEQELKSLESQDNQLIEKILLAPSQPYSREPQLLHCQKCNKTMMTNVQLKAGWGSCLIGALLCISPLIFLFFLPCCMRHCKDAHHYCRNCQEKIGAYNFICD